MGPIVVGERALQVVTQDEAATLRTMPPNGGESPDPPPTWRTLADISDDPPADLFLGMLEPSGRTLAYAAPGLQKSGRRIAVYDAERRPREWSRRVSGLGGDRSSVTYFDPSDLGTRYAGLPIWDSIERVARVVRATGSDVLIVDSVLACLNLDERRLLNDPSVPFAYEEALASLAISVLSFAHPPKGQPEGEPFGSFAWVAAHRLTWLGVRLAGEEHRVRWRVRKANERGRVPGLLLSFGYSEDNRLVRATREDDDASTRDWVLRALLGGPLTIADLVALEAEEVAEYLSAEATERAKSRLGKALYRMKGEGWVVKAGKDGRAARWSLNAARTA
jgi:hypothetical protein